ncbi:MAG: hypothetical protein ACE37M_10560 [Henriciella sp.]
MTKFDPSTPVLLLGGKQNAVAVARNLGKKGVPIVASGYSDSRAIYSKYCKQTFVVPAKADATEYWANLLLTDRPAALQNNIVLPCCDESLAFIVANYQALSEHYALEELVPEQREMMLDKQATLDAAHSVGVPAPKHWTVQSISDVEKIKDEIMFPVMVKPIDSYAFVHTFGKKLFIIEDSFDEVVEKVALAHEKNHQVMVVEMIPGPDRLLNSYYTYRTKDGVKLYDYTKSVIRRWPINRGGSSMHQSEWLPKTAEMGQRLFDGLEWQGIANVEFKTDTRDGQLKIIEVNARFTAAHRLVTDAGAPIDEIIYCHLTGQPVPTFDTYSSKLRMLNPMRDLIAFLALRKRKEITTFGWLKSLFEQKFILSYFSLTDPGPMLAETRGDLSRVFNKIKGAVAK